MFLLNNFLQTVILPKMEKIPNSFVIKVSLYFLSP
jgi:hypothetical protein